MQPDRRSDSATEPAGADESADGRDSAMNGYTLICHVQARKRAVTVAPSGDGYVLTVDGVEQRRPRTSAQAESWAIDAVRRYFADHLRRSDLQWGLRVQIPCGTFDFGDWSFEPLVGAGGFRRDEPILQLYRKWSERRDPQSALTGARQLVNYCLGRGSSSAAANAA